MTQTGEPCLTKPLLYLEIHAEEGQQVLDGPMMGTCVLTHFSEMAARIIIFPPRWPGTSTPARSPACDVPARLLIDSRLIDGKIVIHIFSTHFMFSFTLEKCFNSKRCVYVTACFTGLRIIITSTLLSCSLLSCTLCHPEAGLAHRMYTVGGSLTLAD